MIMKKVEVIVYKQGNSWISNINGYLTQLHYSIITKKDVERHFKELQECDNVEYVVVFA